MGDKVRHRRKGKGRAPQEPPLAPINPNAPEESAGRDHERAKESASIGGTVKGWLSRLKGFDKWLSVAVGVFTIVNVVVAILQWQVMRGDLIETAKANVIAARALEAANRPWVWIEKVKFEELTAQNIRVSFVLRNTGATPAERLRLRGFFIVLRPSNNPDGPKAEDLLAHRPHRVSWSQIIIGPDESKALALDFTLPSAIVNDLQTGRALIQATFGFVYYDGFSDDSRVLDMCFRYDYVRDLWDGCSDHPEDTAVLEVEEEKKAREHAAQATATPQP